MPASSGMPSALLQARQALAQAQTLTAAARSRAAASAAALQAAMQSSVDPATIGKAKADQAQHQRDVGAAKALERSASLGLATTLASVLPDQPGGELERLDGAVPLVLLPVRIETRFASTDAGSGELQVRVYPDEIFGDGHEPELTQAELDAGKTYWENAWMPASEPDAWRLLVSQFPSQRAAWIVLSCQPTNLSSRPSGQPAFSTVPLRSHSWTRAVMADLLPDRWLVLGYRSGAEVLRQAGGVIKEPLPLTLDPNAPTHDKSVDISGDGLLVGSEVAWTVDFKRAEDVGMALRIQLKPEDLTAGFDRLLVSGVKTSLSPKEGSAKLGDLLDSHHFTRGLALVRQGTPTSNTGDDRSGYPIPDPGGGASYVVERGPALDTQNGDGALLALALGVRADKFAHVAGAEMQEQPAARAMNDALWPATLGYFLDQILAPVLSDAAIEDVRRFYVDNVRGRGPLPIFRVGGVPYGLLPVSSIKRWQALRGATNVESTLPDVIRKAWGLWSAQVPHTPHLFRTQDPDQDLLDVLAMDASAREIWIRTVLGADLQSNLFNFLGVDFSSWLQQQRAIGGDAMTRIGYPALKPRVLGMNFADQAALFRHAFVTEDPPSETAGLNFDYVAWICGASLQDLKQESLPTGVTAPEVLFYQLLRHAALLQYANAGTTILVQNNAITMADRWDTELVGIVDGTKDRPTIWQRLDRPLPAVTGSAPLGQYLSGSQAPESIASYRASLTALEGMPTAELERLFTETLDTCSHRLDAWVTALASQRLGQIREASPFSSYIGAFGWVEDLRPTPPTAVQQVALPDDRTSLLQPTSGGYIHAPSMTHAAAAAILRSGYLSRAPDERGPYAVNLSSHRVRNALWLLDTVRNGQPLGAALGYVFERGLHDRGLDVYIDPLRQLYPLVAPQPNVSDSSTDAIPPRNVVNGLTLREAWSAGTLPFGTSGLPGAAADKDGITAELTILDDMIDGLTDLMLAEAIYQSARGNTDAASASLDSMAQGVRPPDPEVARAPRGGTALTHRVGVVVGGAGAPADPWGTITPRAEAEPYLNAWIGTILGDPGQIKCRVSRPDPSDANKRIEVVVSMAQLNISPLDTLALATTVNTVPFDSQLDRMVAYVAFGDAAAGDVRITYDAAPGWGRDIRTFPEILEVANAANAVIGGARPMGPGDLMPPEAVSAVVPSDWQIAEAASRADTAKVQLASARDDLSSQAKLVGTGQTKDLTALRAALQRCAQFGIAGAFPTTGATSATLLTQANSVLAEANNRVNAAENAAAEGDPVAEARAVFGRDFLLLTGFMPHDPAKLAPALAAAPNFVADPNASRMWLQQVARIRPALGRWRKLSLYAQALGEESTGPDVVQLPYTVGETWVALPPAAGKSTPAGRTSLVLHRITTPAATDPWAGLLLDEWSELIPSASAASAISFHYDSPIAEAPQAVLVAVPPAAAASWSIDVLGDILNETLDLAKIRGVDSELLGDVSQLLPAIFAAFNVNNDTVSIDFSRLRTTKAPIGAAGA